MCTRKVKTILLNCSNSLRSEAAGSVMHGGHHTSLFTILPAVAKLLRLTIIQGHTFNLTRNTEGKVYIGVGGCGKRVNIFICIFSGGWVCGGGAF